MATPPVFSVGQYNTAAYMNSIGLWLVKTQTIGTAVTTVTIDNVFTSDFTNYRIVVSGGTQTAANGLLGVQLRVGGVTSTVSYYNTFLYSPYTGGVLTANTNNGASWPYVVSSLGTLGWTSTFDLLRPFVAAPTAYFGGNARGDLAGLTSGYHNVSTAYDGILFGVGGGTMTGGTIKIYGYRD